MRFSCVLNLDEAVFWVKLRGVATGRSPMFCADE